MGDGNADLRPKHEMPWEASYKPYTWPPNAGYLPYIQRAALIGLGLSSFTTLSKFVFQYRMGVLLKKTNPLYELNARTVFINSLDKYGRIGLTGALFSLAESAASFCRDRWDCWNPLISGVTLGSIYFYLRYPKYPLSTGWIVGGCFTLPYVASEVIWRYKYGDDDLLPTNWFPSDTILD